MRLLIFCSFFTFLGVIIFQIPAKNSAKINGVSLVNPPKEIDMDHMEEVKRVNAQWVSVIPYAFSRSGQGKVTFDHAQQWWGERTQGTCKMIEYAQAHGLKVMLKPHVWVLGEGWTGDFDLASEEAWSEWERSYKTYILNHAKVADSMQVEIFCIGTEYRIPARKRPSFWKELITEVRTIYGGQITYASNWDNYDQITWWDAVDFIGIDSYFPLASGSHPSVEQIKEGWEPVKRDLAAFSLKWDKPILFTEYGFQSANGAAGPHWEVDKSSNNINEELQADAYEATFQSLQNETWWKGGFFWKWHFTSNNSRWKGTEWTPQGKPAEQVIARWYQKIN